jgi:NADPH:quinone reductase-like Zn-dependent oxidoreductase
MVSVGALGMDTTAYLEKMSGFKASSQEHRVVSYMAQVTADDLATLGQLLASEEVASVIDRTFPLELVAQAMAMQGGKRIRGKVVLVVKDDGGRVSG